jgi:hypothetical protein
MPRHRPTNIEDFRAGRFCRVVVDIELQEDDDGARYLAEAAFEGDEVIGSATAGSPAGAFAGAVAAAGELLAREHSAARIYHEELQERLGIGYYQDEAEAS